MTPTPKAADENAAEHVAMAKAYRGLDQKGGASMAFDRNRLVEQYGLPQKSTARLLPDSVKWRRPPSNARWWPERRPCTPATTSRPLRLRRRIHEHA